MHVRLTRIVQPNCLSLSEAMLKWVLAFSGASHYFLQDGYVWSQLQRPRRLSLLARFLIGQNLPHPHCSVGLAWALEHPSVHPRYTPTLPPDAEMHEARSAGPTLVGGTACKATGFGMSAIAAAVSRSELSAWEGTGPPSYRTRWTGPSSVPSTTCLGHQHLQPLLTHKGIFPLP